MFSKDQLLNAIDELENSPATYQNAEKLATFYTLYDHLYVRNEPMNRVELVNETVIDNYGDSEFLKAISDKNAMDMWLIVDELMSAVKVLQPRLYQATLDKVNEQ